MFICIETIDRPTTKTIYRLKGFFPVFLCRYITKKDLFLFTYLCPKPKSLCTPVPAIAKRRKVNQVRNCTCVFDVKLFCNNNQMKLINSVIYTLKEIQVYVQNTCVCGGGPRAAQGGQRERQAIFWKLSDDDDDDVPIRGLPGPYKASRLSFLLSV